MERDCKREKKENCEKRSPLQNLNGLPIQKFKSKNSSGLSCSAAVSGEAPKICSRSSLSENSHSSSSSSSFSRTFLDKRSKAFSRTVNNEPDKSRADTSKLMSRSKENEISRRHVLRRSRKYKLQCLNQREYGKSTRKPIYKSGKRSKLSSVHGNPDGNLKKGSQEFQARTWILRENGLGKRALGLLGVSNDSNLNCAQNCSPVGSVASGYGLDSINFGGHETVVDDSIYDTANGNKAINVKTPPVEASLSPEIQCQTHSKMMVLKSAETPVCYGAGHLVSGVTDKRKCKRRGSLRGGPEKGILFDFERSDDDVIYHFKDSSIPLLAQASVRWHLSPCDERHENHEIDSHNTFDRRRTVCEDASGKLNTLSSHSMLIGNSSSSLCAEGSYSGNGSVGNVANERRNSNVILSPRKATKFRGVLEPSDYNMVESLLATSLNAAYCSNGISLNEGKHFSENLIGDNSRLSIGSLNSVNIIQTPESDTSYVCGGMSGLEAHDSNIVWPELDSVTEKLEKVNLSPRRGMSMLDAPALGFHFANTATPPISVDHTQLQKNVDSISSWMSDITLSNLSLSQMRISWHDGLGSRIIETDGFDCCCFLSDEEINADGSASEQQMLHSLIEAAEDKETCQGNNSCQRTYPGAESEENKGNGVRIGNDLPPVLLECEPCIYTRGKGKSLSHGTSACAESIYTDGGGLLASEDSDWTDFHENHLFRFKSLHFRDGS